MIVSFLMMVVLPPPLPPVVTLPKGHPGISGYGRDGNGMDGLGPVGCCGRKYGNKASQLKLGKVGLLVLVLLGKRICGS